MATKSKKRKVTRPQWRRKPAVPPAKAPVVSRAATPKAAEGDTTLFIQRESARYDGDTAIKLYLREIGQVKLLTPQEEIVLAARIKRGDKKAREQMIKANLRLVVKIARDYEGIGLPLLDLISGRLTDGWRITGITTFQTGIPVTVGSTSLRSATCNAFFEYFSCWDRPDAVKPVTTFDPRAGQEDNSLNGTRSPYGNQGNYFFDPNAFQREPVGTLGNAGRNFFHGPGINNFDFALMKDTRITESTRIELRFEFFNFFNHTNFSLNGVSGNAGSSNFGRALSARTPIDSRVVQLAAKFYF